MISISSYAPIFELTRGETVESIHEGAVAVVDAHGRLLAWYGDPDAVTFLRSTAKPFQVMPFIEHGGADYYQLSPRQIAVMCASHSGTDDHVQVVRSIQEKAGIAEAELLCGVHEPIDEGTARSMRQRGENPTSNRHNCSGKHTGMLAYVHMLASQAGDGVEDLPYIDPTHRIQQEILETFANMCALSPEQVALGIDGCSAPNFAAPLRNVALAYARLCDPEEGSVAPVSRAAACHRISAAMMAHPDMVGGPGRFDTCLMEVARGRIVTKGGAEAFQGIGVMPGALGPGSPALGIAMKIADGDARGRARSAVALEVLRQLGALSPDELMALSDFGPRLPVLNWRKIVAGQAYPVFELKSGSLEGWY